MEKKKILSVVFPVEFIISNSEPMVIIRHTNGQPLRMCQASAIQEAFDDILDGFEKSLNAGVESSNVVEK